jgi:CRP/FNR family transcriptional regulator, cyclic AMP receptor protein
MENLQRVLLEHRFLQELTHDEARVLVGCAKNQHIKAGQFLFREGTEATDFFLLRRGRVSLESHIPGRGAMQMETIEPGDIVGLSWLCAPHEYHLDARATESVVALVFNGKCLRSKMDADPRLGFLVTKRLLEETAKRLQRVRLQRLDIYRVD